MYLHPTAHVSTDDIGEGCRIWHLAQVREGAVVGPHCTIGRGSYIDTGVHVGANCKIQNHALIYGPAVLEDGVFIGPAVILTNDRFPRAVTPNGQVKSADQWNAVGVTVRVGASIGAGAICLAPATIGPWAMIAAGSIVTKNVPSFALVAGSPARRIGWVGKAGFPLRSGTGTTGLFCCPETGTRYKLISDDMLEELS